jgi:histidyl-tRNA synthetase
MDAETIALLVEVLRHVGFADTEVMLGSVGDACCRPAYLDEVLRPALLDLGDQLCETCRTRTKTNPMRVFDCKVKDCIKVLADAPRPMDHLCEECDAHQTRVEELLRDANIPFRRESALVRGLDYYTRTVFEVHYPALGAQSALGGGGRYDRLVGQLGGPSTPAVGFSAGIERILLAVEAEKTVDSSELKGRGAYLVLLDAQGEAAASRVAASLRELIPVEVDYSGRSMKAQLKTSNARGVRFALILGDEELAKASVTVKDLDSGEQVTLPELELKEFIRALA